MKFTTKENPVKIRRLATYYVGHIAIVLLFVNALNSVDITNIQTIDVINSVGLICLSIITIRNILTPYLLIFNGTLVISRDLLYTVKIPIESIERIETHTGFFLSNSIIHLKNQDKISFQFNQLSKKSQKILISSLNVPISE
jgi:hypothetical protein